MAQEGIGAALTISPDIMKQLETAQGLVDKMAAGAERIGAGFQTAATSVSSIVNSLQGKNLSMSFNVDGTIKEFTELGNVTVKLNQNMSAAEKGAAALNKALNMKEGNTEASLNKKIAAINEALLSPGLSAEKVSQATAKVEELRAKIAELRNEQQRTFDGLKNSVGISTSGNIDKLRERLDRLKESLRQLKALERSGFVLPAEAIKSTENAISALNNRIKGINATLNVTARNAQAIKGLFSSVFSPIMVAAFLKNLVEVRGEFEMAQRSLAVLIQNERVAADMFDEISRIAIKSPFSVMQLNKQVKQLAAYRIENEKLIETTKMLGDISAGVGIDMNRLILAYGQVKATTWLKGTELRQFSEAGVNMLGGLADRFSEVFQRAVSTGEVMQMISKRMVKFEDVDAVLRAQTSEGGAFFRMQEKQAETLKGMIVNLQDRIQIMFNETGSEFDRLMKNIVNGIQWVISNARLLSNILLPLATTKVLTGLVGIFSKSALGAPIIAAVKDVTAQMKLVKASGVRSFGFLTRSVNTFKAALAGVGTFLKTNIVGVLFTVASAAFLLISRLTQFGRELKKIMEDANTQTQESVAEYNRLLDIATDIAYTDKQRAAAIEDLKKKYGQILPIQNLELSNVQQLNSARAEQIELIKEQIRQEARADIIRSAIKDLDRGSKSRTTDLFDTMTLYEPLQKAVGEFKNIEKLTRDEVDGIRRIVETEILEGTLQDADAAAKRFFELYLTRANATEEQVEHIFAQVGEAGTPLVLTTFDRVFKKLDGINEKAAEAQFDYSAPRMADAYLKEIDKLEDVRKDYIKKLSLEQKAAYDKNPHQLELDVQAALEQEKWRIQDAIENQSLGEISETWSKKLSNLLADSYRRISDMGEMQRFVKEQLAAVADEFPNLINPLGTGELAMGDTERLDQYVAKIHKYGKEVEFLQEKLVAVQRGEKELTEGEGIDVFGKWAPEAISRYLKVQEEIRRTKYEIDQATQSYEKALSSGDSGARTAAFQKQIKLQTRLKELDRQASIAWSEALTQATGNLLDEAEAIGRTESYLGERAKRVAELNREMSERQKHEEDVIRYGKDLLALAQRWNDYDEAERAFYQDQYEDKAIDLGIDFPRDTTENFSVKLDDLDKWINNEIVGVLGKKRTLPLNIEFSKTSQASIKAQQKEIAGIADDLLGVVQKQGQYSEEVMENLWASLNARVKTFNEKKDTNFTLELPVKPKLDIQDLLDWVKSLKDQLSEEEYTDLLMKLLGAKKSEDSDRNARARQYQSDLKTFVQDVTAAIKQFDKLDDEGDTLLRRKLEDSAKKLNVKLPDIFDKAAIDEWVEGLKKKLGERNYIDIRLAANEEDTADWIKNLSDRASALWDKYDNAKKLEGWGFGNIGVSSASIMSELEDLEKQLRAKETEEATKSADQIKEKRLQILRTEQEEAVKIMYEAQKKALTETEQAYQSMYEDIAKIRNDANKGETKFSQEQIDASVQDRIVKGMKEVEKAEWNAYKSTRAYAMAFGDLDSLGLDVLETLQAQLEYYSEFQNLNPSDMKAVADAMLKVNAAIEQQKTGQGFGGVFLEGFKQLAKAQEIFANRQSYEDSITALKDEVRQTDELVAMRKTMVRLYAGDEAEQEALADALAAQADARKRLEDAIKNYEKAMEKADTATEKAGVKLGLIESAYNSVGSAIGGVISLVKDTASIFGDGLGPEAEAAIEGFQQGFALVGQTIAIVNGALSVSASLAKLLKKEVATVLWPLAAVGVALGAVVAIFKSHNAKIDKQIEENKEAVENLKKAYDSLKESMENAMNLRSSAGFHSQMIANLNRQIELVKEQIALEEQSWRSRKKKDENIKEFNDQITELEESIRDTQKDWLEFMGSFSDSRNEAKSWASSWLDAFKDAGDGLESLGKSFEDLYDEIVAAQLSDILMPQMEALKQMIASAVSDGFIDEAESAAILAQREALEGLEDELRERARQLGVTSGDAETDTLQRGIQSITEQTAQALESILNSTRYYVADNNRLLARMENALSGEENENSILANIRSQTRYLQILSDIANAVFSPGSSGQGAGGLKVFVMG